MKKRALTGKTRQVFYKRENIRSSNYSNSMSSRNMIQINGKNVTADGEFDKPLIINHSTNISVKRGKSNNNAKGMKRRTFSQGVSMLINNFDK